MTTVLLTAATAACGQENADTETETYRLLAIHDEQYGDSSSSNDCYYDYDAGLPPNLLCENAGAFSTYTLSRQAYVIAYDASSGTGEVVIDGGRVQSVARHDASSDRDYVFSYDGSGLLSGWLATRDFGDGFPSASTTTLTYDGDRLTSMNSDVTTTVLSYDDAGLLVRSQYTLNLGQLPTTTTLDFTYDDTGRLTGAVMTNSAVPEVFTYALTYDDASGQLGRYEVSVDGELRSRTHLSYEHGDPGDFQPSMPTYYGVLFDLDGHQRASPQLMTDQWFRGATVLLNL